MRLWTAKRRHREALRQSMAAHNAAWFASIAEIDQRFAEIDRRAAAPFTVPPLDLTDAEVYAAIPGVEAEHRMTLVAFPGIDGHDVDPDRCWRCDAARSETDVGLCPTCHADLTAS